jgi:hypothetical protein
LETLEVYCGYNDDNMSVIATAIADLLQVNTAISSLSLRCIQTGIEEAISTLEFLKIDSSLKSTNLTYNSIHDTGASAIANALK